MWLNDSMAKSARNFAGDHTPSNFRAFSNARSTFKLILENVRRGIIFIKIAPVILATASLCALILQSHRQDISHPMDAQQATCNVVYCKYVIINYWWSVKRAVSRGKCSVGFDLSQYASESECLEPLSRHGTRIDAMCRNRLRNLVVFFTI
ncbi:hypothetical protein DFH11DRAFT_1832573 [Phellopilus nigrolimitatus]|nr:hypothetical protein DFH11DRAFT_1832573 [Phellopilus nigrolimitatus]